MPSPISETARPVQSSRKSRWRSARSTAPGYGPLADDEGALRPDRVVEVVGHDQGAAVAPAGEPPHLEAVGAGLEPAPADGATARAAQPVGHPSRLVEREADRDRSPAALRPEVVDRVGNRVAADLDGPRHEAGVGGADVLVAAGLREHVLIDPAAGLKVRVPLLGLAGARGGRVSAVVEPPDHLVADLDLAYGRGEREIGDVDGPVHRPRRGGAG